MQLFTHRSIVACLSLFPWKILWRTTFLTFYPFSSSQKSHGHRSEYSHSLSIPLLRSLETLPCRTDSQADSSTINTFFTPSSWRPATIHPTYSHSMNFLNQPLMFTKKPHSMNVYLVWLFGMLLDEQWRKIKQYLEWWIFDHIIC